MRIIYAISDVEVHPATSTELDFLGKADLSFIRCMDTPENKFLVVKTTVGGPPDSYRKFIRPIHFWDYYKNYLYNNGDEFNFYNFSDNRRAFIVFQDGFLPFISYEPRKIISEIAIEIDIAPGMRRKAIYHGEVDRV